MSPRAALTLALLVLFALAGLAGCTVRLEGVPPGAVLYNPACMVACQAAATAVDIEGGQSPAVTVTTGNTKQNAWPGAHTGAPSGSPSNSPGP